MDVCLKCELCSGFFGDSGRWPRVLGCGHSICTLCTHLLLKNSAIICPRCNEPHPTTSPNLVPLNHTVLKLLGSPFLKNLPNLNNPEDHMRVLTALVSQNLSLEKSGSKECHDANSSQVASPSPKKPEVATEPSHHAGICEEHGQYLLFWCNKCLEWICRDCTIVTHPHSVCPITTIRHTLRDMQTKEDKLISNTIKHFDENLLLFREKHQLLKGVRNQHRNLVKELQHIISLHRNAERLLEAEDAALQDAMSKGLNICFMLLASQGNLLEASSLQEILATRLKAQEYQSAILNWFDPNLLKDSSDLLYSREIQEATEAALATMKQKMAVCGRSLNESPKQLALPVSATTTPNKGADKASADNVKDIEKLLFDSSEDSGVTGWLVLSPTVLHKANDEDEVDEETSDQSDDHNKNQQDQNIDEARKTGAIKKKTECLVVKVKGSKDKGNDPKLPLSEMQSLSLKDLETVNEVEGSTIKSIILQQLIKESLNSDLHQNLMNIIGKEEVSVEVKDIISRYVSIKQNSMISRQLLTLKTTTGIETVEEKLRTILLVTSRDMVNNAECLKEKDENYEITERNILRSCNDILKSIEEKVEKLSGPENSPTSKTRLKDSETIKTEDLELAESSDKLGSGKAHEEINEGKDIKSTNEKSDSASIMDRNKDVAMDVRNHPINNEDNEACIQNEDAAKETAADLQETREQSMESKENEEKNTVEDLEDVPDIKKSQDICKHQ